MSSILDIPQIPSVDFTGTQGVRPSVCLDASLVEATAVMSRLLSNEAFLAQLARARQEYARLRRQ